jgi:hypothetical protein
LIFRPQTDIADPIRVVPIFLLQQVRDLGAYLEVRSDPVLELDERLVLALLLPSDDWAK